MIESEIKQILVDPETIQYDVAFAKKIYNMLLMIALTVNDKINDTHNKEKFLESLNTSMQYLMSALKLKGE